MKITEWTAKQVMEADGELRIFLGAKRRGAVKYKANLIHRALEQTVSAIRDEARGMIERYQKIVDGQSVPITFEGRPLPTEAWASDPVAYREEEQAMLAVVQTITFPVTFTFEELADEEVEGAFFEVLFDCIDPPKSKN